jgi:hypothetical protein
LTKRSLDNVPCVDVHCYMFDTPSLALAKHINRSASNVCQRSEAADSPQLSAGVALTHHFLTMRRLRATEDFPQSTDFIACYRYCLRRSQLARGLR